MYKILLSFVIFCRLGVWVVYKVIFEFFFNYKLNFKKFICVSLRCLYLIGNYISFIIIFLVMLFFVIFY